MLDTLGCRLSRPKYPILIFVPRRLIRMLKSLVLKISRIVENNAVGVVFKASVIRHPAVAAKFVVLFHFQLWPAPPIEQQNFIVGCVVGETVDGHLVVFPFLGGLRASVLCHLCLVVGSPWLDAFSASALKNLISHKLFFI